MTPSIRRLVPSPVKIPAQGPYNAPATAVKRESINMGDFITSLLNHQKSRFNAELKNIKGKAVMGE
jgi:hypothetical protein